MHDDEGDDTGAHAVGRWCTADIQHAVPCTTYRTMYHTMYRIQYQVPCTMYNLYLPTYAPPPGQRRGGGWRHQKQQAATRCASPPPTAHEAAAAEGEYGTIRYGEGSSSRLKKLQQCSWQVLPVVHIKMIVHVPAMHGNMTSKNEIE